MDNEYYVDGGCRNQGVADRITWEAYGSYHNGKKLFHFNLPNCATNNEAEYTTLIMCLEEIADENNRGATIYTDSRLMVGQLTQGWKVKAQNLKAKVEYAEMLLNKTGAHLVWVPRKKIVEVLGH